MKILSEIKSQWNVKEPIDAVVNAISGKKKSQFLEEQIRTEPPVEDGEENENV
tara:strand:+ start:64 stop:222 length:159 start_codon:yes stop_codon:yes gene_type:complete